MIDQSVILIPVMSAFISGFGVFLASMALDRKKEKVRKTEREHDLLKLELKDLQIKLYQVEKDLNEWKEKYYNAIQELISVRAELEDTIFRLSLVNHEINEG